MPVGNVAAVSSVRYGKARALGIERYRRYPPISTKPEVVRRVLALQTCVYDPCLFGDEDDKKYSGSCAICLIAWNDGENVAVTRCGHPFHEECVCQWLKDAFEQSEGAPPDWDRATCPTCRTNLCTPERMQEAPAPQNATGKCCFGCIIITIALCILVPSILGWW
eukprot:gnl/TRDRNA2_/TRDRNA2_92559_c0_seq1.p1 gnl/TRDRNA2_/TRDRNA2_92559_c0~~gnl/TRDRNA2_/TRDRNA2_92559_c0_seq1.p1  ORF type:complete len:165 (-),score=7.39 gnl/TRDRNA2_/TRDRNA2_92559_c0_seq1:225-719(-)